MEINDYCRNIDMELSQWKKELSHIVSKFDSMPTSTKEKVYEEVNELHIIITELGDRIERLRTECSIAWQPETDGSTPTIAGSSKRFNDKTDVHFDYDFGG